MVLTTFAFIRLKDAEQEAVIRTTKTAAWQIPTVVIVDVSTPIPKIAPVSASRIRVSMDIGTTNVANVLALAVATLNHSMRNAGMDFAQALKLTAKVWETSRFAISQRSRRMEHWSRDLDCAACVLAKSLLRSVVVVLILIPFGTSWVQCINVVALLFRYRALSRIPPSQETASIVPTDLVLAKLITDPGASVTPLRMESAPTISPIFASLTRSVRLRVSFYIPMHVPKTLWKARHSFTFECKIFW